MGTSERRAGGSWGKGGKIIVLPVRQLIVDLVLLTMANSRKRGRAIGEKKKGGYKKAPNAWVLSQRRKAVNYQVGTRCWSEPGEHKEGGRAVMKKKVRR